MNNSLFGIPNLDVYLVVGVLLFFIVLEIIGGYWSKTQRQRGDWIQEAGSYFVLALLIKPSIVLVCLAMGNWLLPGGQTTLSTYSTWLLLPLYLLIDDLLQYWYHRSAHEYPFLWKLHRTHHQAEEMGFFISYRNAALYYVLMPNIWWIGLFTFLGGAQAAAIGIILKQLIIIGSHSTISYDKFFYKYKWLNPFTFIFERIFITPAFHHAHHGKSMKDGISDPNGNYGNMFSIWDQLFGTATFTRKFPTEYGLENDPKEPWSAAYLFPFVKAKNPASELSSGFVKEDTRRAVPSEIFLEKEKKYLYCTCGKSKNQPFCDGTHHGSKFKPAVFEVKRSGKVQLCNCKKTKAGPFCDNSHLNVDTKNN